MAQMQQQPQGGMVYGQAGQPAMGNVPAGTTVVVVQQVSYGSVNCPEASKIMTDGLFGCCDDAETCLCAYFCGPCAIGTWVERAGLGDCCGTCCMTILCSCGCFTGGKRGELYRKLGLQDPGCCMNCMCHTCCPFCAVAQEGRAAKALMAAGFGKPLGPVATR